MIIDPLTEVTRKQRKWLLGTSLIAIIVGKGVFPREISIFGIKSGDVPGELFPSILLLVLGYLLFSFLIYAAHDYVTLVDRRLAESPRSSPRLAESPRSSPVDDERSYRGRLSRLKRAVELLRAAFDFILPVFVGLYAGSALLLGELNTKAYITSAVIGVVVLAATLGVGALLLLGVRRAIERFRRRQISQDPLFGPLVARLDRLADVAPSMKEIARRTLMRSFLTYKRGDEDRALEELQSERLLHVGPEESHEKLISFLDRAVSDLRRDTDREKAPKEYHGR